MKNHSTLYIILVCILLPWSGTSQPLDQLLKLAAGQNQELKALQQEYQAALEVAPQLSQMPDPELGVGAFVAPVETRLGAQRARLSASQMFPWFGTLDARAQVASTRAQAMYEQVESRKLDIHYQVKNAYFQLYELEKSEAILRRNIRILQALRQLSLSKVESGRGNASDVLRVDLNIQELEQELLILANQRKKPLAEINQLLDRPLENPVQVQDSLTFARIPFQKDTLLEHIRMHHPMIRMYAIQQQASRKTIELNDLESKPSFGFGMDYILVNQRTDADPLRNGRDILQLNAKVNIPLFREKYKAKEREEQIRIAALENRKANVESQFLATIEKAYADYETARLRQELYLKQIKTTRAAIRMLQAEYSNSGSKFDELLRLESSLVDYDLKMLRAVVQSQIARATIERYIDF